MAGLAGLPYFIQAQGQLQEQAQRQQLAQQQLTAFQQAQQDRQRLQAVQAAAGNAYPQLGQPPAPPQGPPPQPPMPGQASQPAPQMAGGGAPLPQGPLPPGMSPTAQRQGAMPPPPFRPMPTTPPVSAQAPQGAIPAPPPPQQPQVPQAQPGGGWTMEQVIKAGRDQGLEGADLFQYMQIMQPVMDTQARQQAAAAQTRFNQEIQLQRLSDAHDSLEERIKHDREIEEAARGRLGVSQGNLDVRREKAGRGAGGGTVNLPPLPPTPEGDPLNPKPVAGYSSDAIKALGDDYAARGPSALSGFGNKNFPPAARSAVVNYAAAKNASTGQNFATNKIQFAADTAGARSNAVQAAKVDAAANALVQEGGIGDQFQQATDALQRTGIPFANQAQMQVLRLSNDPRVAAFDAAENGVVSEAAQILGRGTLTVNSMEEARRVVQGWHTSEQVKAGLAQLKREAATTVKASSEEVARSAKTPKGQPGAATPVKINSDEDYNALPSGAQFIAPDGTTRRKP